MKRFSPITHISFTLCAMLATLMFLAIGIGLVPNQIKEKLTNRAKICEDLAIQFCGMPHENIIGTFEALAPLIVERNEDILSIAFRGADGQLVSQTKDHQAVWQEMADGESMHNQVQIPIYKENERFGTIEIAFSNIYKIPVFSYLLLNNYLLVLGVTAAAYIVFRIYLQRMLRYLDPSSVIPGRVKAVLNNLTESVVVLDTKEQIMFANSAFCETTNQPEKSILGKKLSIFPWLDPNKTKNDAGLPWLRAFQQGTAYTNIPLVLKTENGQKRISLVNAMPILGPDGKHRGTLTSFTDVTELEEKNKQLVEVSRSAGMAEVATSVLHNIGNMLNSVNVSATHIDKILAESKLAKLREVSRMMQDQGENLPSFLTEDPKGKYIPNYVTKTIDIMSQEREKMTEMVQSLRNHIEHIKEVIRTQQNYAKVHSCEDSVSIRDLIEDAVQVNNTVLGCYKIDVIREFDDVDYVDIDRQRILQIIVNLLKNAAEALVESHVADKRIVIRCGRPDPGLLRIEVQDNGMGISHENLTKIFRHGFTTKSHGHGFGLHGSSLSAKEMRGNLEAYSEGPGKGTTFILTLPLKEGKSENGTTEKQIPEQSHPHH